MVEAAEVAGPTGCWGAPGGRLRLAPEAEAVGLAVGGLAFGAYVLVDSAPGRYVTTTTTWLSGAVVTAVCSRPERLRALARAIAGGASGAVLAAVQGGVATLVTALVGGT